MVQNLTHVYTDSATFEAQRQGLYLMLVQNESDYAIYDRNGPGKLLVAPNAYMVKPGKFECGLAARMWLNVAHLHRRLPNGDEEVDIFPNTLRLLLVHFMPGQTAEQVANLETLLKRQVRASLTAAGRHDPHQDGRAESRRIVGVPPTDAQLLELFRSAVGG